MHNGSYYERCWEARIGQIGHAIEGEYMYIIGSLEYGRSLLSQYYKIEDNSY